ncbi:MAG: PAS domain S-box protein [Hymenobacter sp.]
MLDHLQLAYVVLDREGVVVEANDTLLTISGYAATELVGRSLCERLVPKELRADYYERLQRVLAGQEPCPPQVELPMQTKTGQGFSLSWQPKLLTGEQGESLGLWAAGHPVAGPKETKPYLNSSAKLPEQTYLREFFDSSHDLILHLSATNVLLFVNRAGQEKAGLYGK